MAQWLAHFLCTCEGLDLDGQTQLRTSAMLEFQQPDKRQTRESMKAQGKLAQAYTAVNNVRSYLKQCGCQG